MKTIHKFPLEVDDSQRISMPDGAEILTVQMQNGIACIWALIDTDKPYVFRNLIIRGTGHDAENAGKYIGTFQMQSGELVFHVFEMVLQGSGLV